MPETLRQIIDKHIEWAFSAGAQWALIRTGVDAPKADRHVNQWMRAQELPSLRIIQRAMREQLYRALVEAVVGQTREAGP